MRTAPRALARGHQRMHHGHPATGRVAVPRGDRDRVEVVVGGPREFRAQAGEDGGSERRTVDGDDRREGAHGALE